MPSPLRHKLAEVETAVIAGQTDEARRLFTEAFAGLSEIEGDYRKVNMALIKLQREEAIHHHRHEDDTPEGFSSDRMHAAGDEARVILKECKKL